MNLQEWNPYYKIDPTESRLVRSNMLYTPLINPEGNIFCMNWDSKNPYQLKHGPRENFGELIEFFFNREIENLTQFKRYNWSPEIVDIDLSRQQIFFKWYGETCNNIIYGGRDLDQECPSWQQQLYSIIDDIFNMGYYKPSLYPHCFYIDDQGMMHTFDFYACIPRSSPFVKFDLIKGMVGPNSMGRFDEAMRGDEVNVEILFKRALEHYIKWPDDALLKIYRRMFS
jgi:hypothetical protein